MLEVCFLGVAAIHSAKVFTLLGRLGHRGALLENEITVRSNMGTSLTVGR